MSNNNAYSSKVLWGVLFTVLFSLPGLVSCGGGGGSTTANTNSPLPTVSLSATSTSIPYGGTTTLNWSSTNSTGCTLSGGEFIPGPGTLFDPIPSSRITSSLIDNTTYTVRCAGAGGQTDWKQIEITVASSAVSAVISGFANAGGGKVRVTTANTLTNGFAVTISGTTSYNGTYTVENRTATTFDIAATFVANDATGIWQLAGGMIPGCSTEVTAGSTGAITLSNAPSRFGGVAPLSVFFDASGTTATATTRPFHDLEYQWNFGDSDSTTGMLNVSPPFVGTDTWNTGSRPVSSSRNTATGPVSAHVYETPGIYTVALTAKDGTNEVSNRCAQIVVYDPNAVFAGTNTICIGATSLPVQGVGGCPSGASGIQQSNFSTILTSYAASGKRLLLKRSDTFTSGSNVSINITGPGIIGSFGSGASPIILKTDTSDAIKFNTGTDWRVMDLMIDGGSSLQSSGIVGSASKITVLRVTTVNLSYAVSLSSNELAVVDSNFTLAPAAAGSDYGIYTTAGSRGMIIGNLINIGKLTAGHGIRVNSGRLLVISNNTIIPAGQDALTIRGDSQYGAIADNKFIGDSSSYALVTVQPQNSTSNEAQQDMIIERNWMIPGSGTSTELGIHSVGITIRNNIFELTGAASRKAIAIGYINTAGSPMPDLVNIYNNTFYTSGFVSDFRAVDYGSGLTSACNSIVKNNLAYAPNATSPVFLIIAGNCNITGASGTMGNSSDAQIKSTPPNFASPTPSNPEDFIIGTGSYRNMGVAVPVYSDFFRTSRPVDGTIDIGASEGP